MMKEEKISSPISGKNITKEAKANQNAILPSIQINKLLSTPHFKDSCNSTGSSISSTFSSRSMSLTSTDDSMDGLIFGTSPIPIRNNKLDGTLTPFSRSGEESPLSSRFENSSSLAASVCNSSYSDLLDDFCTGIHDLSIEKSDFLFTHLLEGEQVFDENLCNENCLDKLQKHLSNLKSEIQDPATPLQTNCQVKEETEQLSKGVEKWMSRIVKQGFGLDSYSKYFLNPLPDENDDVDEEDDTWFEKDVLRIFDPYVDIRDHQIEEVEGRTNTKGCPIGKCNVKLKNGDSIFGSFKFGIRQGRGATSGDNLFKFGIVGIKGYYKDGILEGEGRAILAPGSLTKTERVTLEGFFSNGYMEGPVRGLDEKGNVVFIGAFEEGIPKGPCWLSIEGQGWLHGNVDSKGKFSGNDICYLYPDLNSCIYGQFQDGQLVAGGPSSVIGFEINENKILHLKCKNAWSNLPVFSYTPSTKSTIPCNWLESDHYEDSNVTCGSSKIDGAGDGLFARKDLPENRIVSYYNGLYINHGETYSSSNCNYQIYLDWRNTDKSSYVDIPEECIKIENYRATLGHKANHSFVPNCQFVVADHPRFGRIPSLKTIKPIQKGEELFCHYKYDSSCAPQWYLDAWATLNNANTPKL